MSEIVMGHSDVRTTANLYGHLQKQTATKAATHMNALFPVEERLKAGERWVDTGLVFTTYRACREGKGKSMKVGAGLDPRNVLRAFDAILNAAKLPHMRFHDLRHSAASLLVGPDPIEWTG